ncbi:MAG: efflux RND transporter periplasmic adaptor subunit [Pseudomonadota bacterium]
MTKHPEATSKTRVRKMMERGALALGRFGVTLAVIAGAVFAVQIGASELERRADAAPTPAAAPTIPVSTSPVVIEQGYTVQRAFIGQVEPQKTAAISFELPGRLDEIIVDEGDWVSAGQLLARQDTSLLRSEQDQLNASKTATQAQLRFAGQTVDRASKLTERGFTSQAGLDEAMARQDELRARIAEIEAGLSSVAIRIQKSEIKAPFDGRVTARLVDGGETLGAGQQVLGLVELRKPQVRIGVPLDVTEAKLKDAKIDIDGTAHEATLVTLRPDINPVTRTRTAIFEIDTVDQPAFGQTARLIVAQNVAVKGLWVSTTSLKEGVRGQWTLLAVDAEDTVRAATVEILHAESDRVFVRGAFPDGARLIEEGPQRVTVGQRVTTTHVE